MTTSRHRRRLPTAAAVDSEDKTQPQNHRRPSKGSPARPAAVSPCHRYLLIGASQLPTWWSLFPFLNEISGRLPLGCIVCSVSQVRSSARYGLYPVGLESFPSRSAIKPMTGNPFFWWPAVHPRKVAAISGVRVTRPTFTLATSLTAASGLFGAGRFIFFKAKHVPAPATFDRHALTSTTVRCQLLPIFFPNELN